MNRHWFRWWWLLFLIPLIAGMARLKFDVELLNLLPSEIPAVEGLKIYQRHFTNARELIVTVRDSDAERASAAAQSIAKQLRTETNLVADVTWRPPWLEHPEQTAELIAYAWLNQRPESVRELTERLAEGNLPDILAATRDELSTTLSPTEIAQLSYDPFGLTRLPEELGAGAGFGQGDQLFSSPDGTFRILFIRARDELSGYRECTQWFNAIKQSVANSIPAGSNTSIGYTGRPAFVAEISAGMQHDITLSVGGTAVIIAILFWLAHRRWKPMLWLLTLLAVVLIATLALGGLVFGSINVISMGFAAILLGLAVDYAVVHYQEALAHPNLSIPHIRRGIAPSIFWAATTTIVAFLLLNFGGLPGLAQLGSLVGIGVALSAFVMIYAFLPPLFPHRMTSEAMGATAEIISAPPKPVKLLSTSTVFAISGILLLVCGIVLLFRWPQTDATADALQPRDSQAYATLTAIKQNLGQDREPLWLIVAGRNETEVAQRLDSIEPILKDAVTNKTLRGFTSPRSLWARPELQVPNKTTIKELVDRRDALRTAALSAGFSEDAFMLTDRLLTTWSHQTDTSDVTWPTNHLSSWIFERFVSRQPEQQFAVAFLYPSTNAVGLSAFSELEADLPRQQTWLSSWELLGGTILDSMQKNIWKLVIPMVVLILASLWLAFRSLREIILSLSVLVVSGLCLLAIMGVFGMSWNLLNLMAVPLLLGTGIDYSIFMQGALRRHQGDLAIAHQSVGRALLLCGGTAIAGFGGLGLSSNAGMASLGQVCAIGIAGNMLFSVYLLPTWWKMLVKTHTPIAVSRPSQLYGAKLWELGVRLAATLPYRLSVFLANLGGAIYWHVARHRRGIVIQNLLPVMQDDPAKAKKAARALFSQFTTKIVDLWRYEGGQAVAQSSKEWDGWDIFTAAHERRRGVLLVTAHLGNWEFGAAFLARQGVNLLVLTQPEPDQHLTEMRQASRARWGIETLVVGQDEFAFVEIIKRLQDGATVALLLDRPPAATAVPVQLFGRPFQASIAAAELARASGCAIVPAYVVCDRGTYAAKVITEISYDREKIGSRDARIALTQEILRAFESPIRQYATQWYHFVPVWP